MVYINNGSSNNLPCYPPESHQSHNAAYWRTGDEHSATCCYLIYLSELRWLV